jgi:hypothetical protein
MSDGYRDPLAAARSRIEHLERENAALKRLQSGRPATAAELEIVRLENELRAMDLRWEAEIRARYGMAPTAGGLAGTRTASWAVPLLLVIAAVLLAVFAKPSHAGAVLGVFGATAVFAWLVIRGSVSLIERQRAAHQKMRQPVEREIARLRGGAPLEGPRVRVAEGGEAEAEAAADVAREEELPREEGRRAR